MFPVASLTPKSRTAPMEKQHPDAAPEKGGRHYKSDIARAETAAKHSTADLQNYLEEHKAASTRDRLAHQALVEGRN